MIEITDYDIKYWHYEYEVVAQHLMPLLRSWGVEPKGAMMLDVGGGDGGGVSAMYDAGMICKGFDIETRRVQLANQLRDDRKFEMTFGDIYKDPAPYANEKFDLVVLHDVFEHLDRKAEMLMRLKAYLKPNGKLMITFPPYYSAFGAHQQLLRSKLGRLPFFHLIPFSLSAILPKLPNEHGPFVEEIQKLGRLKMGVRKFESLARDAGLRIDHKKFYIISPNHIRFGLTPAGAGVLGEIPFLRELIASGVVYLLSK